jgi:hypothetical protein
MKPSSSHSHLLLGLAMLPLLTGSLNACYTCVAVPMESVLITELESAEHVVVASPLEDGRYERTKGLKGDVEMISTFDATYTAWSDDQWKVGAGAALVTRSNEEAPWVIRGPAEDEAHLAFYRNILDLDPAESKARLAFFAQHLHAEDPILARSAAAELAQAPYRELCEVRDSLDLEALRRSIDNPTEVDRFYLYYTLLGLCGDAEDLQRIERGLARMSEARQWRGLGALWTARLELAGESVVGELEVSYFLDSDRTLPEVEETVFALQQQGEANGAVPRERVIEAYDVLIEARPQLAFLVIEDFARWGHFDSKPQLEAIVATHGPYLPELQEAMVGYLATHSEATVGVGQL